MPFIVYGCGQKTLGGLLSQFDEEVVAIHAGILQAVDGVILELIVTHVPLFVPPFRRVRVPDVIEFIRPDKLPAR
jgi:hypothetical protein